MGMSVTNDRLTILNQYQQQNIAVQITDLKDDNGKALGTRVDIRIPVDEMWWYINTKKSNFALCRMKQYLSLTRKI